MMRKCARAIILNEQNQLLVFERERQHGPFRRPHHYYSIPGGGVERDETPEQAVVRELYEEMLVRIRPGRLVVHQLDTRDHRENFYFLSQIIAGTPTFNSRSEEARNKPLLQKNSYKVTWADLDDPLLAYFDAYGQIATQLATWLKNGDFPSEPVDMRVKNR